MDYQKHYDRLIERARNRVISGYVEVHHILPRCIGGSDDRSNLVQLTAEEHFVAHQLLHKMYPNVSGLTFALICMTGNPWGMRNNKLYGWMRKKVAVLSSEKSKKIMADPEVRQRWNESMEKFRADPERMKAFRERLSKAHKGRVKSAQERANISESRRKVAPRKFSDEARENMRQSRLKTWEERRASGTHLEIAKKTKATRIANGSYQFSEEWKKNIGRSGKGRIPWNKGLKISKQTERN